MRTSNWYGIDVCVNCKRRLRYEDKMRSDGVCPKCGHSSGSTICRTEQIILRQHSHHPWWRIWDRKYTFEGLNDTSKEWLKNRISI